jgi:hypothetical protein
VLFDHADSGKNSERVCPGFPTTSLLEIETSCGAELPIREFAGDATVAIWRRAERGEDEESS